MNKKEHLDYLESYLTPHRKLLFDKISANRTRHFTIVAEDTYQEHNASALIRNCDCFGIQDLHIIEEYNRYHLAKGMTQGTEKWVDLHYYSKYSNNTQNCIDTLKSHGYSIIATTPHACDSRLENFDIKQKSAFFFGKERKGLSQEILDQADAHICIPMFGFAESFNISISVALVLQNVLSRLRESIGVNWHLSLEEVIDLKIKWCIQSIPHGKEIYEKYLSDRGF